MRCPKLQDLGALPQTLLKNFLKEVFKNFKNFNKGEILLLCLCGADFFGSRLPCCYFRLLRAKSRRAGFWRLSPLSRYRIEVVGKLVGGLVERPVCRSVLIERFLLTYSYRKYRKRRFIPPHQSLNATNCLQFSSPQGEAFHRLCKLYKECFNL